MALPSATNIYSGAQPFPTLTPGAGLWLISHQLAVNTGASTLTFTVTVGGRTVYGNGIGYYKAAGITSVDFPIQVLAAAAEDIIVSVLSTNSSDTAVTSNTPSAVLQSVNTTQVDGTDVGLATEFDANVIQISGDAAAADNLEAAFDGTGYAGGAIKQKVDLDTIKTQAVTCAAGVTVGVYVGGTAAAAIETTAQAIVTDTNELQTDNIPGLIAALNDPTAASIADAVWDEGTGGHVTGDTFGAQCGTDIDAILADTNELQTDWANGGRLDLLLDAITVQGSGSAATTILCQVGGVPIDGVEVWITTDIGGANVVAGTVSTDALGEADFMLDPGDYYVWRQKSGYNFTNPQTQTVA